MTAARPLRPALRSQEARNALVTQNYALAFWAVQRVWHLPSVQRLGREDAEAAAVDGLLRAAELWDERFGVKFVTYAVRAIYSRIFNAANKRYRKVIRDGVEQRHHTEEYISDGVGGTIIDRNGEFDLPYEDDRDVEGRLDLQEALRAIPDREYGILLKRFRDGLTLGDIAAEMNITKERVRQLQNAGIKRLRVLMTKGATGDCTQRAQPQRRAGADGTDHGAGGEDRRRRTSHRGEVVRGRQAEVLPHPRQPGPAC